MLELASTMGASRWKVFSKIRFPASLPPAVQRPQGRGHTAVTGAVVGEFVGANSGLGYVILQANGNIDTATLFVALIIMSLLGVAMFAVIELIERLVILALQLPQRSRRHRPVLKGPTMTISRKGFLTGLGATVALAAVSSLPFQPRRSRPQHRGGRRHRLDARHPHAQRWVPLASTPASTTAWRRASSPSTAST